MTKDIVEQLIYKISISTPNEKKKIMDEIKKSNELNLNLFIMHGDKMYWQIASEILKNIGFPAIECVIDEMLIWLQDVNWPGAYTIIDTIVEGNKSIILPHIETALLKAEIEDDCMWIGGLNMLINRMEIEESDFSSRQVFEILKKSDF